jgi:hypothetical protein
MYSFFPFSSEEELSINIGFKQELEGILRFYLQLFQVTLWVQTFLHTIICKMSGEARDNLGCITPATIQVNA